MTMITPTIEDALLYTVGCLQGAPTDWNSPTGMSNYGYELYVPKVIRAYYREAQKQDLRSGSEEERRLAPPFLDAAWELCRRGVLRPGVRTLHVQSTEDGSAGSGFSITPFGRAWLAEPDHDTFVPTEPERFGQLLEPYRQNFGSGFHLRAQEAIRCYGAHAYLACCAMCGAAAESIMLAIAAAKVGEDKAIALYLGANGRSRVEKLVTGQLDERLRRELQAFSNLLKYWRDASAHGRDLEIGDNEAFTSIALLLRLAASGQQNWASLIESPNPE